MITRMAHYHCPWCGRKLVLPVRRNKRVPATRECACHMNCLLDNVVRLERPYAKRGLHATKA